MSRPRPKISAAQLKRPTVDTKFHIDFEWWEKSDLDLKTYVVSRLGLEDQGILEEGKEQVDLVDDQTGEVRVVDGFQYALQRYFRQQNDDFTRQTSLVDAVFYTLLAHTNRPMSARELAEFVDKEPEVVLKTISGPRIYQGIRPIYEDEE